MLDLVLILVVVEAILVRNHFSMIAFSLNMS